MARKKPAFQHLRRSLKRLALRFAGSPTLRHLQGLPPLLHLRLPFGVSFLVFSLCFLLFFWLWGGGGNLGVDLVPTATWDVGMGWAGFFPTSSVLTRGFASPGCSPSGGRGGEGLGAGFRGLGLGFYICQKRSLRLSLVVNQTFEPPSF